MIKHSIILFTRLICLATLILTSCSKSSLTISVNSGDYDRENSIVVANISDMGDVCDTSVCLYEKIGDKLLYHQSQVLKNNDSTYILFILNGETFKGNERTFIVNKSGQIGRPNYMDIVDNSSALTLTCGDKSILSYNYTTTMPPEGVNKIFARSGYIHPAFTPSQFILTEIQPKDHRHHYGIWNPWTKLEYDGKEYDLWNLGDGKGTVKSKNIIKTHSGCVMCGFDASLEHIIKNDSNEKVIMDEIWKVKAWNYGNSFLWDFESHLTPSTELPILIKEYRYAGFGYRANTFWTKENCEMFSSEGLTRQEIDGTRGRWIYINGVTDSITGNYGGLLILGSPNNYNYPEPLRIWNEKMQNVGYAFINFAPTKNTDWLLEPKHTYKLSYRLIAYDGKMTPERAEMIWRDYAYPLIIKIK